MKIQRSFQVNMSILLSGDFHANADKELFTITEKTLLEKYGQEKYDSIKYHIILGDAGFLWPGNESNESVYYRALSKRPFPILSVLGNHDPILGRSDLPEVDIGIGEKVMLVNKEKPFVAYLQRGKVYRIENHKFLVLGGALSIDKEWRQQDKSWWKNEYWSEKEKRALFGLIKKDNCFDYVLSHTGPYRINKFFQGSRNWPIFFDEVAVLNEKIEGKITCKQWFCVIGMKIGIFAIKI